MISDRLYELAFAYKKAKLWRVLWDNEIFAVRLSGGRIGYCSVMGAAGEYCALALYVGGRGFQTYRTLASGSFKGPDPAFQEVLLSQDCLQCAFENKDELSDAEIEGVRRYARAHGIALRGRFAFPQFVRYQPNRLPWPLMGEEGQADLCEALAAGLEVARRLAEQSKEGLGLRELNDDAESVPLLERRGAGYVWSRTGLPDAAPASYPVPSVVNDISAAKVKRMRKTGIWECQILRFPQPVQDSPEEAPYFPVLLLAVDSGAEYMLPVELSAHYDEEPEELLELFAQALLNENACPAALRAQDERTFALLQEFCSKAGIRLRQGGDLPALEDAKSSLMEHFGAVDGLDEEPDFLAGSGDPEELLQHLAGLLEREDLPEDFEQQLAGMLRLSAGGELGSGRDSECSYVISVSCGTGCYRHIRISVGSTLCALHQAILDAFGFDNDHAHAFFLDNSLWSERDAYYAEEVAEGGRATAAYRLDQTGIQVGKQFKYLFDFGDSWVFQCKVLRELDEDTDVPVVIRSKGEPPAQHAEQRDC